MKKHKAIVLEGDSKHWVFFENFYVGAAWNYWTVFITPRGVPIKTLLGRALDEGIN